MPRGLDIERGPWRAQPVGDALGGAHQLGRVWRVADTYKNSLARRPRPAYRVRAHVMQHLLVDALGGAAQGELAQRGDVAGREVVLQRALRLLADIDLAVVEA